jgi:hypothetical protein
MHDINNQLNTTEKLTTIPELYEAAKAQAERQRYTLHGLLQDTGLDATQLKRLADCDGRPNTNTMTSLHKLAKMLGYGGVRVDMGDTVVVSLPAEALESRECKRHKRNAEWQAHEIWDYRYDADLPATQQALTLAQLRMLQHDYMINQDHFTAAKILARVGYALPAWEDEQPGERSLRRMELQQLFRKWADASYNARPDEAMSHEVAMCEALGIETELNLLGTEEGAPQ